MEESKIRKIINDFFKEEEIDEETMKSILLDIREKKIDDEGKLKEYLENMKKIMDNFIIDDSEFDE